MNRAIRKVLTAIGVITGVTMAAGVVGAKKIYDETQKKCRDMQGKNTQSAIFFLGKNTMTVKENTDFVFPSAILGKNVVDLTKNPIRKDVYVDYKAVFGKVVLCVPKDAEIVFESIDYEDFSGVVELQTGNTEMDPKPVIHVSGTECSGKMVIIRG